MTADPARFVQTPRLESFPYTIDASRLVRALRPLGGLVWLDSGNGVDIDRHGGRFDIITAGPVARLEARGNRLRLRDGTGHVRHLCGDPFAALAARVASRRTSTCRVGDVDLPFSGGVIGYFGYELGYAVNHLPRPDFAAPDVGLPDLVAGVYDWAIMRDHLRGEAWLMTLPGASIHRQRIDALLRRSPTAGGFLLGALQVDCPLDRYLRCFDRALAYIAAGDCYQVNLSRGYHVDLDGDALAAYLALRSRSPAPYGAYLDVPQGALLSLSPERFLTVRQGVVETRPIKGTRPRGATAEADEEQRSALRASAKDRAENVMIVDLLRNDLGRACVTGSVQVPELFAVETHPTVHHLVSTVTGHLPAGRSSVRLLRHCFPGGSITGAPKRRAMEIIAELEQTPRSAYCGAIGYLGHDGAMDCSIAIRTAVLHRGRLEYRAGGGLVSDSHGPDEFQETEHKARAFLSFVQHDE